MFYLISALAGLVFGLGLIVSGMIYPVKVQNFLDVFGAWDPSLALVMGGALLVTTPGFFWLRHQKKPLLDHQFYWPGARTLDVKLITGSALFGIGWGLIGLCPGPALTLALLGDGDVLIFLASMFAGMAGWQWLKPSSA